MSWQPRIRNSERPEVSVVMPTFNHREFVYEAIASVLAQGVPLELLIQDDCSTDGTWDLIQKIRDPRVYAVQSAHNRASHPRNFARDLVKGRFVAFMNSDDRWAPGKLKAQLDRLRRLPRKTISFTGAAFIGADGSPFDLGWSFVADVPGRDWLLRKFFEDGNCVALASAMIPTAFLNQLGWFHPAMLQASDWDLWIRALLMAQAVDHIPEFLTEVRYLDTRNLSSNPALRARLDGECFSALDNYFSLRGLRRFRQIFDPQKAMRLAPFVSAAKRIWITRIAMAAPFPTSQRWGAHRYNSLLRRPGYARLCRSMFAKEAVEDYDTITRRNRS